jgi:hypothetical protein
MGSAQALGWKADGGWESMAGRIGAGYFTAPAVSPAISWREASAYSTIRGSVAMAEPGHQRAPFGVDRALQAAQGQRQGVVVALRSTTSGAMKLFHDR